MSGRGDRLFAWVGSTAAAGGWVAVVFVAIVSSRSV